MNANSTHRCRLIGAAVIATLIYGQTCVAALVPAQVPLPNIDVAPTNVAFALSVEFPTGDTTSYLKSSPVYKPATTYYGYFDPAKCYNYDAAKFYFSPVACAAGTPKGNFLNWVTMTSIDQFRQILTGGNRIIDTATQTVLQRSFNDAHSGGGYMPDVSGKYADAGNMGSAASTWAYSNVNLGDKLLIQNANSVNKSNLMTTNPNPPDPFDLETMTCPALAAKYKARNGTNAPWTCYHVRVAVCVAGSTEDNCVQYGANYKPEGLIQKYNKNLRFAAFGYLIDTASTTQGGVLRARMESVGPTKPSVEFETVANTASEWDSSTGVFIVNPDPADAAASTAVVGAAHAISTSGVINYLNGFGYNSDQLTGFSYKQYDPMAELYYEVLRYLRGLKPSQAVSQATAANWVRFDGSPVIKFGGVGTTDDPVENACQPNVILTIGDVNNWCDTSVPGGKAVCGQALPLPADAGIGTAFADATNTISGWEGGGFGTGDWWSAGRSNGWYLGGMAYWAHTSDIRPDLASGRPKKDIQNVDNYFFDVLEPANGGALQDGTIKTPMYMAAKYGGFDRSLTDQSTTTSQNDPTTSKANSTAISWDNLNNAADHVPDHWFGGNDPQTMKTGLRAVFDQIASAGTSGAGAAPAASGVSLATALKRFFSAYTLENGGRGSVKACSFYATDCVSNPDWDAASWLNPGNIAGFLDSSKRQIITRSASAGIPFYYDKLSPSDKKNLSYNPATQVADPVTAPTIAEDRVNYLRGDAAREIKSKNGGTFRSRFGTLLGDIVDSGVVYVGAAGALYSGDKFPKYRDFVAAQASRAGVLYGGANDGMLHAFDVSNGKEKLAYIPRYFLQHDSGKNAARISTLTDPTYGHAFFVDATPMVGDIDPAMNGSSWETLLVGGYGAGGKGFYALDVTDPAKLTEDNAGSLSKWELSDADDSSIGYTYNQPTLSPISGQVLQYALVPTSATDYRWAIIVGNGFGSSDGTAVLLFIDPKTGSIFQKLEVSGTADNGLATPFPVDTDQDGLVDTIWAGDLQGTMWRIRWDMKACKADSSHCKWVSTALFAAGSKQPITSAPAVSPHCSVAGAYNVVFGTGKYIERTDYTNKDQQSVYGILDNLGATTVLSTDLVQQTILTGLTGSDISRTYSQNPVDYASKKGWYIDLPTTNGERTISNPALPPDTGLALVGSFVSGSTCMPLIGYVNIVNACTGGQAFDMSSGIPVAITGISVEGSIPYLGNLISSSDSVTFQAGAPTKDTDLPHSVGKPFNSGVRASWRQIR